MKKPAIRAAFPSTSGYSGLLGNIGQLLESARRASARAVNAVMTATYWEIGRRIVEFEQGGHKRADYGERLLENLSTDLTSRFGRGFGLVQIRIMRQFFLSYPENRQSVIGGSKPAPEADIRALAGLFPLSWTHYTRLLRVAHVPARRFYSLARYALEGLPNQTLVREYRTVLPDEKSLATEIDLARKTLESKSK